MFKTDMKISRLKRILLLELDRLHASALSGKELGPHLIFPRLRDDLQINIFHGSDSYETALTYDSLFGASDFVFNTLFVRGMAMHRMAKSIDCPALVQHPCAVTAGEALLHHNANILR